MKVHFLPAAAAISAGLMVALPAAEPELVPLAPASSSTPAPTATPGAIPGASASGSPGASASPQPSADDRARNATAVPGAKLAKFLPPAPPRWKIGEESAEDALINEAPGATATHLYYSEKDPAGEKTGVRVEIADWVNSTQQLRAQLRLWSYTNEKDESGYIRPQVIAGYPAQETWVQDGQEHTLALIVGGRFLVEITTYQQQPEVLMQWLNLVDLKTLATTKP